MDLDLTKIQTLVKADLDKVDTLIDNCLTSDIPLIPQIAKHLIHSGGKRLRPLVAILSAKAFNYQGQIHLQLAAALDLIHTATLLHDDVVDSSTLRRSKKTANKLWGNSASVLVGDFLYSRAFQLIAHIDNTRVLASLANATNLLSQTEILQLLNCHNPDVNEAYCLKIIQGKTAVLFSIAAQQPAILAQRSEPEMTAMQGYGLHLGTAFQLIDDTLDYSGFTAQLGKPQGNDLVEGKPTLPLIYALQHADKKQAQLIRQAIIQGGQKYLAEVKKIIESTHAIHYVHKLAKQQIAEALAHLQTIPDSSYRQALATLAESSINRSS